MIFNFSVLVIIFLMLNATFAIVILDLISRYTLYRLLSCYRDSLSIPHSLVVFIYYNLYWRWLPRDSHHHIVATFISFP